MLKHLTVWITTNCRKFLKNGTTRALSCHLRNLYVGQDAKVRKRHGKMDRFKFGKGICQDCILSPWLFNLYGEYIKWNSGLEAQTRIKIARININNLRYVDDHTLNAESEELKSLLKKVEEEWGKAGLKLYNQIMKIMASSPITSWQRDGEKNGNRDKFYFLVLQIHCGWWLQSWN